jgi:DnaJ-domain-containing protein 1
MLRQAIAVPARSLGLPGRASARGVCPAPFVHAPKWARRWAHAAPPSDAFALLGVDRRFNLDERVLSRCYKGLMAEVHPDRHGGSSACEQKRMADRAASITSAFALLQQPHTRAAHLLELEGVPLDEGTSGDVLGPDFLLEVMETREALEAAGTAAEQLAPLREANAAQVCDQHLRSDRPASSLL